MNSTPKASPVDKTRAIANAAWNLATNLELHMVGDGAHARAESPKVDISGPYERHFRHLAAALALPEPEWTTMVPDQPGDYFWMCWRDKKAHSPHTRAWSEPTIVQACNNGNVLAFGSQDEFSPAEHAAESSREYAFKPVPMEPPRTT